MPREQQVENMIEKTIVGFGHELKGYKVFLFGSRASGTAKRNSDFDIGILGQAPLPIKTFFEIEEALLRLPTLYKIDLVDFQKMSPQFRELALKEARIIYE